MKAKGGIVEVLEGSVVAFGSRCDHSVFHVKKADGEIVELLSPYGDDENEPLISAFVRKTPVKALCVRDRDGTLWWKRPDLEEK